MPRFVLLPRKLLPAGLVVSCMLFSSFVLPQQTEQLSEGKSSTGAMKQTAWSGGGNPGSERPELDRWLDRAVLVGSGTFEFAFWDVYDANLYSRDGQYDAEKPFALELVYHRSFKGRDIADRSAELIRQQGLDNEIRLASWHSQMEQVFPDVKQGTRLTGIRTEQGYAYFLLDGELIGRIRDQAFTRYFFGIWLGQDTKAPQLREQLIGSPDYADISR